MNCSVILILNIFYRRASPENLVFRVLVIELNLVQACYLLLRLQLLFVIADDFSFLFCSDKIFSNFAKTILTYQKTQMYSVFLFKYHFPIKLILKFHCVTVLLKNVFLLNCLLMILFLRDHLNFDQYHFIISQHGFYVLF